MRVMGVDFGEVRVGLALSDETCTLATPLTTILRRRGKRPPLARIEKAARQHDAEALVFGLPLELTGEDSAWSLEVRRIARELAARLDVPVFLIDERLSSVRAKRAIRHSGNPKRKRESRERVDSAAAAIILQDWIDSRATGP
jgi:putative Holliday junction resolvase